MADAWSNRLGGADRNNSELLWPHTRSGGADEVVRAIAQVNAAITVAREAGWSVSLGGYDSDLGQWALVSATLQKTAN